MVGVNRQLVSVRWSIVPRGLPEVARRCARCNQEQPFACSERFRVNAQKRRLDVWLIYRCTRCEETWNLPVHERVTPEALGARLLGYLENDPQLARHLAHDLGALRRAGASARSPDYDLVGAALKAGSAASVQLEMSIAIEERVDRLLARALGLGRARLASWLEEGAITVDPADRTPEKTRLRDGQVIVLPATVTSAATRLGPGPGPEV